MKLTDAQKLQLTLDHQDITKIIGATICARCGFLLVPKERAAWEEIAYARAAHVDEIIAALEANE